MTGDWDNVKEKAAAILAAMGATADEEPGYETAAGTTPDGMHLSIRRGYKTGDRSKFAVSVSMRGPDLEALKRTSIGTIWPPSVSIGVGIDKPVETIVKDIERRAMVEAREKCGKWAAEIRALIAKHDRAKTFAHAMRRLSGGCPSNEPFPHIRVELPSGNYVDGTVDRSGSLTFTFRGHNGADSEELMARLIKTARGYAKDLHARRTPAAVNVVPMATNLELALAA